METGIDFVSKTLKRVVIIHLMLEQGFPPPSSDWQLPLFQCPSTSDAPQQRADCASDSIGPQQLPDNVEV